MIEIDREQRILLLAPTERDAEITRTILSGAGLSCRVCRSLAELCRELREGAAAALVTEEAVSSPSIGLLHAFLDQQPPWSDLPVIVLTHGGASSPGAELVLEVLPTATLLERPVRVATIVSAARTALRARRRQYQIREHLRERERTEAALVASEERLRRALSAARMVAWEWDLRTGVWNPSEMAAELFGRGAVDTDDLLTLVHPEDRQTVLFAREQCIQRNEPFDLEFRMVVGSRTFWVAAQASLERDENGGPLSLVGMCSDITARKVAEELLRESDRRKDEFLAMLAHELRNPLAPIVNAVQLMRMDSDGTRGERSREIIERQVRHMARLIDDLLDLSRISTGKVTLRKQRVDLAQVVRSAVDTVRPFLDECRHELTVQLPEQALEVDADPARLEQILSNLLNNAGKYTEPGGRISVSLQAENGEAVIRVQDNGIGIGPELLPHVFDLFRQGARGLDRSQGGLGIGLTLVRNLVALHGGRAEVHSEGPGKGSKFTLRLPLGPAPAPAIQRPPAAADTVSAPSRAPGEPGARRLLVVDDNRDAAESMADLAAQWGYEVQSAYDGTEALRIARSFHPSTVFLDIGMPGMDGYAVARELRQMPELQGTLLVAMTGYGQEEDVRRSREAGFDHHLVKPIDFADLTTLLSR